jgi:hypothetical protein
MLEGCMRDDPQSWVSFLSWFSRLSGRVLGGFPNLHPLEREETVAESRLKLVAEIQAHRLKPNYPGELVNYARLLVKREAIDRLRAQHPRVDIPADVASPDVLPSRQVEARLRVECLERLLRETWSVENRFIFMMKINEVPSHTIQSELARSFGFHVEPGTIDVRFHRLRRDALKACG